MGLWVAVCVSSEQPSTSWGHCLRGQVSDVFPCPEFRFFFSFFWEPVGPLSYPCFLKFGIHAPCQVAGSG